MSNVDQSLYDMLTQAIGAWSSATGVAPPSQEQIQQWAQQFPGNSMSSNLGIEGQNIGYYWNADQANLPQTTAAQITAAAQADPRWSQLDPTGQQILTQLYNLQAMGYGGDIGQNTPLPAQTPPPSGDTGIQAAPTTTDPTTTSAWSQLEQTLQQYGFTGSDLQALQQFAQQEIIQGKSADQITLDLQQQPEFQKRFPAIGVLSQQGVAITPAEYISLEQQYAQLEHAAGIPPDYASYDALIAGQVSPSEYADRINKGYLAVETWPSEVKQAMQDYYGVTPNQLVAHFLNPNVSTPQLMQQAQAAQIGGASAVSGFGQVSQSQALRLAQQGVTYSQAQQGFQQLAGQKQLYTPLPGQGQRTNFTTDQLLGAQFGSDGQTKLQLQIQADQEKNYFNQGSNVAGTQQGLTGTGTVQR